MCGFVGFLGGNTNDGAAGNEALLQRMTVPIINRGPDDVGQWFDAQTSIGFGHRRLAIVDLSAAGHQPMFSTSGRYVISYNGEIYNHQLLRKTLESNNQAPSWRGHSDTETLLAGFEAWGIQQTIERSIGMFAIAVWDKKTLTLTLARDRIGEKPLYYGWQGQGAGATFLFGSELKALRVHPAFENKINRSAITLQLRHNYIPAPYSIYEGISKLVPGSLLTVSMQRREPEIFTYWSGIKTACDGVAQPFTGSPEQAVDHLEVLLKDAVGQQMMADVPLGAFLSGGVDSSAVVALMQAQSSRPIKTFTIGFHEAAYNEAEYAKVVAKHLGTDHTELYVTPEQALAVIPRLPVLYDEPFSDSSQIPTFLVSHLARQNVTVSLSGDAGDELFCGYNRYQMTANLWRNMAAMPLFMRKLVAGGLRGVSVQSWNQVAHVIKGILPKSMQYSDLGSKVHKGAGVLLSRSINELYFNLVSHWDDPASMVIGDIKPLEFLKGKLEDLSELGGVQRMMALDLLTYLPDDILVKVDRAAMGVSLETRVPFLDHRVVEFAWRLPLSMKLCDGKSKWILRQILYRHVPKELIERPKMGFGVPIGAWLRSGLRDWAESLLSESRLKDEGIFYPTLIRQRWQEHLSGKRNWEYHLWDILMFQAWFEQQ